MTCFFISCCRMTSTNGRAIIAFIISTPRRTPTLTTPCEGFSSLTSAGWWFASIRTSSRRDASWISATWRPMKSSCFRRRRVWALFVCQSVYLGHCFYNRVWLNCRRHYKMSGCWCASSCRRSCRGTCGASLCGWRISSLPYSDPRLCSTPPGWSTAPRTCGGTGPTTAPSTRGRTDLLPSAL